MKLGQAVAYHATTPMDGWDGTSWTFAVTKGDFHTFDRFITERSFGLKKRVFTVPGVINSSYLALRDPLGGVYLITSQTPDFHSTDNYLNTYLILQADFSFEVLKIQKTENAAGVPIGSSKVVVATFFGDMERYSGEGSYMADHARYSVVDIVLPAIAKDTVNVDSVLRTQGEEYVVTEALPMLRTLEIKAVKREG